MPAIDLSVSRKREIRVRWALFAPAVALMLAVCMGGCSHRERNRPASDIGPKKQESAQKVEAPEPESGLNVEFGKARILWNDDKGRRMWEAQFKEAVASQVGETAAVELTEVEATLYRNGQAATTVVAPRVVADSRTKEVRASGGVKLTSVDGGTAICRQIVWKAREDKVTGTGGVSMRKGNISITARTMEADTALKKARFTHAQLGMD